MKAQYDELYKRNAAAEAELESNIKQLIAAMDAQKGARGGAPAGPLDQDEIAELAEREQLRREQLDIVESQKVELEQQLTKAHGALNEARAERDAFWSNEIKKLQSQLASLKSERDKLSLSSQTYQQLQLDHSSLQKEHAALQKKYLNAQVAMEQLEREVESATEKEKSSAANLLHAERDLESLLKTLQNMEKEIDNYKRKEIEYIKRENESLAKVEAIRLEKQQVSLREQSLANDLRRADERLRFELSQAQQKSEEELTALYERSKEQESKLQNEINNLSLVVAELESNKDKLTREANNAKSLQQEFLERTQEEMLSLKQSLNAAQSHVSELQTSNENLLTKLKRNEAELSRSQEFFAKEKQSLSESVHALKLKNENLTLANQNLSIQSQRSADQAARLDREFTELKRISESTIGRLQSQLLDLEAARKNAVDDLKARLDEAYRMHENSEARAVELLAAQDVLAKKWAEENKHVRQTLTKMLTEEKQNNALLNSRVAELEARVNQLIRERDQAMAFEQQYEQLKKSHETAVADFTHRINVLTQEISTYASRDAEFAQSAKTLQSRLDRAEIEVRRLTRQYETQRKKAEFLEAQTQGINTINTQVGVQPMVVPLGNNTRAINQSGAMLSSSVGRPGAASTYQPIPLPASLLPPAFNKKG